MTKLQNSDRAKFRQQCRDRDNHTCIVPWCTEDAEDVHHIIERKLWTDGGYITPNGVSICNHHHQAAETNDIPPQAFWEWIGLNTSEIPADTDEQYLGSMWWDTTIESEVSLPDQLSSYDVNKWGEKFDTYRWEDNVDYIKYQSTRHLLPLYWYDDETVAQERIEHDDTGVESVEEFVGKPLVITHKIDGSNCMLVSDRQNPARGRNGSSPEDSMYPLYKDNGLYWTQEVSRKLPERLQVFGEWVYAKHSIHYGCNCESPCEDVGPSLSELTGINDDRAYFQIFGVYDKEYNLWLSWPEVERVAKELGFTTTPVIYCEDSNDEATFETKAEARRELIKYARNVINNGGEGIVVRSKYPFHYGQFEERIGKYVRENHVTTDDHWKFTETIENQV